jgi:hypothetical protein
MPSLDCHTEAVATATLLRLFAGFRVVEHSGD